MDQNTLHIVPHTPIEVFLRTLTPYALTNNAILIYNIEDKIKHLFKIDIGKDIELKHKPINVFLKNMTDEKFILVYGIMVTDEFIPISWIDIMDLYKNDKLIYDQSHYISTGGLESSWIIYKIIYDLSVKNTIRTNPEFVLIHSGTKRLRE